MLWWMLFLWLAVTPASAQPVFAPLETAPLWRTLDAPEEHPDALPDAWTDLDLVAAASSDGSWTTAPVVWFAQTIDLPPAWAERALAVSFVTRGRATVFADGVPLRTLGPDPALEVGAGHHHFALPEGTAAPFELQIRVAVRPSTAVYAAKRLAPGSVLVGPAEMLPAAAEGRQLTTAAPDAMVMGPFGVAVWVAALLFGALFLRDPRRLAPYGWYTLDLVALGAWCLSSAVDALWILPVYVLAGFQIAVSHLSIAAAHRFLWTFFRSERPPWWWLVPEVGCWGCFAAFTLNLDAGMAVLGPPVHELIALAAVLMRTWLIFYEAYRGVRSARLLAASHVPSIVAVTLVLASQMGFGGGAPAWFLAAGSLLVIVTMGVVVIQHFDPGMLARQGRNAPASDTTPAAAVELPSELGPTNDLGGTTTAQLLAASTMGGDFEEPFGAIVDTTESEARRIGRYQLVEFLGRGGMGEVHRARDPELERDVAIKLVTSDGEGSGAARRQDLLHREAVAMARCVHPNVVTIFDVGTHEFEVFLAMEYLRGKTLLDWQNTEPRPASASVLDRYLQAADGLVAAHAAGVVHGDFKAANVMCTDDGRTVVVDFGIARAEGGGEQGSALADHRGSHLMGAGTPAYMAPELLDGGSASASSDQYAFAMSVLHALYGRHPRELTRDPDALVGAIEAASPLEPGVPDPSQRDALLRGIAADPAERHGSMSELVARLRG